MKKNLLISLLVLVCFASKAQEKNTSLTYDYLNLFEKWKLVITQDGTFSVTTNSLFWPDTSHYITGKILRTDSTIKFACDTSKLLYKSLLKGKFGNEELIAQGNTFLNKTEVIDFKNVMRRIYDTSIFSTNLAGKYYRGDGKWSCIIALNANNTYEVSESVHGDEEYNEKGKWKVTGNNIAFYPEKKKLHWLEKYGKKKKFYISEDFLIGKNGNTFYYFTKTPLDWW